jgi:hypothetical protein
MRCIPCQNPLGCIEVLVELLIRIGFPSEGIDFWLTPIDSLRQSTLDTVLYEILVPRQQRDGYGKARYGFLLWAP